MNLLSSEPSASEANGRSEAVADREPALPPAEWNGRRTDYPRDATIHTLFEEQTRLQPHAIALLLGERTMTYGELDRRASALARHLREAGVQAGSFVGLSVERSFELVVAMLAILKAGGVYVPLDPTYPRERISLMLEDARPTAVICPAQLAANFREWGGKLIALEETLFAPARGDDRFSKDGATATSPAYAMFTSGSTGRPKGALIPHRGVVRLVRNPDVACFQRDDVFLLLAPVSFDASTLEIWGALLNGGRLAIMEPGQPSLEQIGAAVRRHQVTTLWLTSGLFNLMVDERAGDLAGLRRLFAGGDVLSPTHVRKALEALPQTQLINGYGPTENTTFTCCHAITALDAAELAIPIGRPIANSTVFILDIEGRPTPVGVPGELHTGGDGLALGYLNQPQLTAERFIPSPIAAGSGTRLYRTGDLCCWLPDGKISFLGRMDDQVKVRGFRIEPGEIESTLRQVPEVADAVVTVREDSPGDQRLVAYVVAQHGARPGVTALRAHLSARLPVYMLPAAFVVLPKLPLTPSGKVDRRALPKPDTAQLAAAQDFVAPHTPTEEALTHIWLDLLQLERIGVTTNFLALGGHSLLALRMLARIRREFAVELPVHEVFARPTIAELADAIDAARLCATPAYRIRRRAPGAATLLTESQRQLWFLDQLLPDSPAYNVTACYKLRGVLDAGCLSGAIDAVVERHEALRTVFDAANGEPVALVREPATAQLQQTDLSQLPLSARLEAAETEARRHAAAPFDLRRGPLFRAALLRLAADEHWLLICIHHIVTDGWSMGIFEQELSAFYRARTGGIQQLPAPLPVQFGDFADWHHARLQHDIIPSHLDFWREQLAGAPEVLNLPADRPRPEAATLRGGLEAERWPGEVLAALRTLANAEGASVFMTALALSHAFLGRLAGESDFVTGSPSAGRAHSDLHGLIGFFVNMLPVRADLSGDPSLRDLVRRTKARVLETHEHAEVPFTTLVQDLRAVRPASYNPIFQVVVLHVKSEPSLQMPGVDTIAHEYRPAASRFDLLLEFLEDAGGLLVQAEYSSDLFEGATVRGFLRRLLALASRALAEPDLPLNRLAVDGLPTVGSSRVDLQACKLEYSIVSPK